MGVTVFCTSKTLIRAALWQRTERDDFHFLNWWQQVVVMRLHTGHNLLNAHMFRKMKLAPSPAAVLKTKQPNMYCSDARFCKQQDKMCGQQQYSYTPTSPAAMRNWRRQPHSACRLDSQCSGSWQERTKKEQSTILHSLYCLESWAYHRMWGDIFCSIFFFSLLFRLLILLTQTEPDVFGPYAVCSQNLSSQFQNVDYSIIALMAKLILWYYQYCLCMFVGEGKRCVCVRERDSARKYTCIVRWLCWSHLGWDENLVHGTRTTFS